MWRRLYMYNVPNFLNVNCLPKFSKKKKFYLYISEDDSLLKHGFDNAAFNLWKHSRTPFSYYFSIDATHSSQMGRLVNDGPPAVANCKMKKIIIGNQPALALFAIKPIHPGDQLLYDYGGLNLPWRNQVNIIFVFFVQRPHFIIKGSTFLNKLSTYLWFCFAILFIFHLPYGKNKS